MDKELLYRFFEGSASSEEMERIQQWLDESPAHQKEFLKQRQVFDAMILLPGVADDITPQTDSIDSEDNDAGNNGSFSKSGRITTFYTVLRYAAVIILSVGITYSFFRYFGSKKEEITMLTASVPAGQRAEIMLPDSTTVWLNSGSVLKYPSHFSKDKRNVVLEGEGYFTVTRNEHKPFIVTTPNGTVTVLGTVFNVKSYSDESRFEAALVSGKVKARGNSGNEVILKPHQKMVWDAGKVSLSSTSDEDYSWKKGILSFNNESLEEVINDLSRAFDRKIVIKDKSVLNQTLSGKFLISDGLDYALQILHDMYGLQYYTNPDTGITEIYK